MASGSPTTFPGAHRLLVLRCVQLVVILGERLLVSVFGLGGGGLSSFRLTSAVWLLLSAVELGLVIAFSRELGTHRAAGRMRLAAGFLAAETLFTVVMQGAFILGISSRVDLFDLPSALSWGLPMALGLAFDLSFWFGLHQVVGDDPQRGALTAAYLFTRLLSLARRLFVALAPLSMRREVLAHPVFSYGTLTLVVAANGLVIYLLHRVSVSARPGEAEAAPDGVPVAGEGQNDLLWGAVWLGGGRYMVTTGAIAYGIVRLFRGLTRRSG
jgi:hypothetical protein